jgi:histidyl-tRNA synthetase
LETPAVENIETLMGKYGEEGNQLIFKILKRGVHESTGQADLALRYDLTVPLARVVAEYKDKLPKFFKRYQIQPVWRADRPARGRFREFYQCDVDVLGSKSMVVEVELCAAAADVLTKLGFNNFTIRINHRKLLAGILEAAPIPNNLHIASLTVLDKMDKIGPDGVEAELLTLGVLPAAASDLLKSFSNIDKILGETSPDPFWEKDRYGEFLNEHILEQILATVGEQVEARKAVEDVEEILRLAKMAGVGGGKIRVSPNLARGLSYYTGAIIEINVPDLAGSLGGGGRYDNLVGMFLGQDVPACGFSLGLERIIVVMTERGMFPSDLVSSPADVMVTIWNEDSVSESIALARELRGAGLRVDLYPEADKLGRQFKYAAARGIQFVAVLGEDERARNEVAIKNLGSGKQESLGRAAVAAAIRLSLDHKEPAG